MIKYQVGDKVEITETHGVFKAGDIAVVVQVDLSDEVMTYQLKMGDRRQWAHTKKLKLVEPKRSKNQRITALEEEVTELKKDVAELKVIVAQMRKPSEEVRTAVAETIEFEGRQYRKVEREAREGDVVVFDFKVKRQWGTTSGKPYKVIGDHYYIDDEGGKKQVYGWYVSCPDPNIYELVAEDKQKTPNQQRAEIIEKAKAFKKEHKGDYKFCKQDNLIVAFNAKYDGCKVGYACCNPSDVFNVHIGKAIALGRALGLDVSEFEQAAQPTFAVGQIIVGATRENPKELLERTCYGVWMDRVYTSAHKLGWLHAPYTTIINDSNAIYGGVE